MGAAGPQGRAQMVPGDLGWGPGAGPDCAVYTRSVVGHGDRVSGGPLTPVLPPAPCSVTTALGWVYTKAGHPPGAGLGGAQAGKKLGAQTTARARGGTDWLRGWGTGRWPRGLGAEARSPKSPKPEHGKRGCRPVQVTEVAASPRDHAILGWCGRRSHCGHGPQDRPEAPEGALSHSLDPGRGGGTSGRVDWGTAEGRSPASKRLNRVCRAWAGRQERTQGRRTPAQKLAAEQSATLSSGKGGTCLLGGARGEGLSRELCAVGAEREKKRAVSSQETLGAV